MSSYENLPEFMKIFLLWARYLSWQIKIFYWLVSVLVSEKFCSIHENIFAENSLFIVKKFARKNCIDTKKFLFISLCYHVN
ncbi:MAG: hypothetical protein IJS99_07825 [Synergistaceae bacterium]|nr:hypothetical protein [Synergistaceae bacterium]